MAMRPLSMGKQAQMMPTLASTSVQVERGMKAQVLSFLFCMEVETAFVRIMDVAQTLNVRYFLVREILYGVEGGD